MLIAALFLATTYPYQNPISGALPQSPHLTAGAPGYGAAGNYLLIREGYAVLFSQKYKDPLWSQEQLDKMTLETATGTRLSNPFRADPDLPNGVCSATKDYKNSGYDQGHMSPAGDFLWNSAWFPAMPTQVQRESFYLSNMVPQNSTLNEQMWRILEDEVRTAAKTYGIVQVITGPIFDSHPSTIGKGVAVPAKVFKIAVVLSPGADQYRWAAYEIPNVKPTKKLSAYQVTIRQVETDSGLNFFSSLPANIDEPLESGQTQRLNLKDINP